MTSDIIIDLDRISVHQEHVLILANITLQVAKGEFVYLVGKTGSGKSSFLKTLYADLPLLNGLATVAGFTLHSLHRRDIPLLRRKTGIVFQDFQLLSDRSINDNLIFVMKATGWRDHRAMQTRLQEVLMKVGLETKGFKMPHQISGGEQQRVGIARALINDPEIVLADEPTGNLDPETSEGILNLLFDISHSGTAVMMATHNYSLKEKFPSCTLKCEDGKILPVDY